MDNNTLKIDIEIPDEFIEEGNAIYIMAGHNKIAYKLNWGKYWQVKTSACSSCGLCCEKLKCEYLREDKKCGHPIDRPFICCVTEPNNISECTSLYKEVK